MKIDVLDHGYVEFIEAWGHGIEKQPQFKDFEDGRGVADYDMETGIVEAARQSTQGNFRGWNQDAKLLKHLHSHAHNTPFEFAGMVIEVQAPIFVFREWQRHRTQSYNEMSARYAPLPDLYYMPELEHVVERARAALDDANKQARSKGNVPPDESRMATWVLRDRSLSAVLEEHYQEGLACGVPKELARKKMPVDHYSRMRASANLRNWLAFLALRMDHKAQYEIRMYANAVHSILQKVFPQVVCLFDNARLGVEDPTSV